VRSEEADIGITGGEPSDADIETLHLSTDRMHVVYPQRHPIARRRKISLEDLAEFPLILMDSETSVRAIVDSAFVAAGRLPIPACEATYMMTAVGMVRAGLGISVLPASAKEIKAEPSLRSRPIDDPAFERRVAVVKKRNRTLPPATQSFLGELISAMRTIS
jgi:DNA-binding transcriptional LysR family regulator